MVKAILASQRTIYGNEVTLSKGKIKIHLHLNPLVKFFLKNGMFMVLNSYSWSRRDTAGSYSAIYSTHDHNYSKHEVEEVVSSDENDFELGVHTLEYNGREMKVRLVLERSYAMLFYDKDFEDELGDEDFQDVITHFLTPDAYKDFSALNGV